MACGGSQAKGRIRAIAAGLHHKDSNKGSKSHLQPTPQLMASHILSPLSNTRDCTRNLMVPSQNRFHCAMMGTPETFFFNEHTTLVIVIYRISAYSSQEITLKKNLILDIQQ